LACRETRGLPPFHLDAAFELQYQPAHIAGVMPGFRILPLRPAVFRFEITDGRVCQYEGDRTVKRKVVLVAGIAALAVGLYFGSRVGAKTDSFPAAPAAQTRVAVMNMAKIASDYKRTAVLRKAIEEDTVVFEKKLKDIQVKMQAYKEMPTDPKAAEDVQKQLLSLKHQGEDITAERNRVITEKSTEGEKSIYKDIKAAVEVFAHSRNIDLVLFYNDVTDPAIEYSPQALQKRIVTSGMPIYTSQGTDVTVEVTHVLNWNWDQKNGKGSGN
jgi:Skp family chaperone for outer membrane proteins